MEYIIAASRSRTETVMFSAYLSDFGINNKIVNTPKEAGVGCGLSVGVNINMFNQLKIAVKKAGLKTFAGYFYVKEENGKKLVRAI